MSSLLGTTLNGRYTLESRIGSGGMSTVYRAHDETLERFVAIKLMNREVAADSDQLERFRREARAVARLSHPNIVHVIDAGEDDARPYIVFECVDGETLKERIRRLGRLEIPEALTYCIEIARALGAAHSRNVVHRDVKPQNVLIDRAGTAKVTDFGIARTLEEDGLTADGRVLGTTDYVAPEQALGQKATVQSDLYSLGVVLYEMLTGELPFKGETQVAVAMKHVREPMPDVRERRPEVSPALAAVVERATEKDLARRYADDAEMIAELETALAIESDRATGSEDQITAVIEPLPLERRRRRRSSSRGPLAVALVAVLVIAAAVAALALGGHLGGSKGGGSGAAGSRLIRVQICPGCVHAYNPDYTSGGTYQDDQAAPLAVDGNPATAWATEHYDGGVLGKPGVGIYVYAATSTPARQLHVYTRTPGWNATVWGTNQQPDLYSFAKSNWRSLATRKDVKQSVTFSWSGAHSYRYYLVWITQLGAPTYNYASINEIKLYR